MSDNKGHAIAITNFWKWFSENSQTLKKDFNNPDLMGELDDKITAFGNLGWEIGPGKIEENALVISPNGDFDLLPLTKQIVANGPICKHWEYYYAKQRNDDWKFWFEFTTKDEQVINIDVSKWEYVLLKYQDGFFLIIIRDVQLTGFSDNDRILAAEIAVDLLLGEETRMEKIANIEVVDTFETSHEIKKGNVIDLFSHLAIVSSG